MPAVRALELFAGIGGFAAAQPEVDLALAIEQSGVASAVYRANFRHKTSSLNLDHVSPDRLAAVEADLWWMSPPCQPFTRRGRQADLDDPRTRAFQAVVAAIGIVKPRLVAMENVPEFNGSRAWALLRESLATAGYRVREHLVCPSDWLLPTRRRRYYLVASQADLPAEGPHPEVQSLPALLLPPDPTLAVPEAVLKGYRHAIHVVDGEDPLAVTNCFTAAYGRSLVRSGSYLRQGDMVRYFAPREVARLLGFPDGFQLPDERTTAWSLLGNSLHVGVVRSVVGPLAPREGQKGDEGGQSDLVCDLHHCHPTLEVHTR